MLTRRQRHDGGDGDDEHHSVTVQHRGPSAQSSAVDGQAVRPNDDSRPQASAPDGGLGGRAPGAKRQAVALPPQLFAAGYLATGTALALMGQVVTNQVRWALSMACMGSQRAPQGSRPRPVKGGPAWGGATSPTTRPHSVPQAYAVGRERAPTHPPTHPPSGVA